MSIRSKIATRLGPLTGFFEKEPVGIVRIDGGFSSQLARYALGWQLTQQGYDIEYDLTFFEDFGKSIDGNDERAFRLKECFPQLEIPRADRKRIEKYRKFFDADQNGEAEKYIQGKKIKEPFYSGATTVMTLAVRDYQKVFDLSQIVRLMSEDAKKTLDKITELKKEKKLVGVHVRRGDMAISGHSWKVLTGEYFISIINRIKSDDTYFLFFSEDFEWVKNNILTGIDVPYDLVDQNNPEYVDFYLYSLCDILVASQSSWGRRAMFFNENSDRKLILPESSGRFVSFLDYSYGKDRVEIQKLDPGMYS